MMFFSRVRIDPNAHTNGQLLRAVQGDINSVHKLMWKLFPSVLGASRDFLYRQEFEKEQLVNEETRRSWPIFYVVSEREPSNVPGLLNVQSKPYKPKLQLGLRFAFDLRANPVIQEKTIRKNIEEWKASRQARGLSEKEPTKIRRYHDVLMNAKAKGRAEGITDTEHLNSLMFKAAQQWLVDASTKHGFIIDGAPEDAPEDPKLDATGYRQHSIFKRSGDTMKFSSVDYSGVLLVNDPHKLAETLRAGIGHSKAFGCGLLLIKPA